MNTYPSLPRLRRLALAASACIASLSLVAVVAMLFDHRAGVLWAGLDAHHARQAAACTADGGHRDDRCADLVVLAEPVDTALR
jgi:hypothetical protein